MAKADKKDKTELILKTIQDTTKDWAEDVFTPEGKKTDKAKALEVGLSILTLSATDKDTLAQLFSIATGETVKIEKDEDLEFRPMAAIVLTKADKHTYETGTVLVCIGDGTAVDPTGKVGSYIKPTRKIVRPATQEEIEKITPEQVKGLMKEVNIVFA